MATVSASIHTGTFPGDQYVSAVWVDGSFGGEPGECEEIRQFVRDFDWQAAGFATIDDVDFAVDHVMGDLLDAERELACDCTVRLDPGASSLLREELTASAREYAVEAAARARWQPHKAVYVDAWPCPDADTEYSVSIGDDNGDEIECIGGGDRDDAWEMAQETAAEYRLVARLLNYSGAVMREEGSVP